MSDPQDASSLYEKPRLPTELWLQILSNVDQVRDLLALSHVSKGMRIMVLPYFRDLTLFPPVWRALSQDNQWYGLKILKAFQTTGLAAIVINFRITLTCFRRPSSSPTCMCNTMDVLLGSVLQAMENLEVLDIHCAMCRKPDLHLYFPRLKARRLRNLSFRCYCGTSTSIRPDILYNSQTFTSLEALRWTSSGRTVDYSPEAILDNDQDLCKLSALYYSGNSMQKNLLATRPIRRICVQYSSFSSDFLYALAASPGSLTHLIAEHFSGLKRTFEKLHEFPALAHLHHIGTVPSIPLNDNALEILESWLGPFVSLRLVSIDATAVDGNDPWNAVTLDHLRNQHHKLQKVLINGDKFRVWEFKGETWVAREVSPFSSWDIIRGACDEI